MWIFPTFLHTFRIAIFSKNFKRPKTMRILVVRQNRCTGKTGTTKRIIFHQKYIQNHQTTSKNFRKSTKNTSKNRRKIVAIFCPSPDSCPISAPCIVLRIVGAGSSKGGTFTAFVLPLVPGACSAQNPHNNATKEDKDRNLASTGT